MSKIYDAFGWVNWDWVLEQNAYIIPVVGSRGVGKTYGIFKKLIEDHKKFIYLRRLKSQLDLCADKDGNPFKKINSDLGYDIQPYKQSGMVSFRNGDKTDEVIALGVALSVIANIRGVDFSDYDYIVFDEFIPIIGEHPIKKEFFAFQNFIETVNRNRELLGCKPVICIMLGNANTLVNPYFVGWHFMRTAIKMIKGNQMVWRSADGTRMCLLLLNSPISEKKKETVLYKNASDDFLMMALDNAFRTDETNIHSEPLKEYVHVVSVGEIGIYKHKSQKKYYVSATKQSDPYYDAYGITLKMFQTDFYLLRSHYMINKNFIFESFELEIIFRQLFNLNNC